MIQMQITGPNDLETPHDLDIMEMVHNYIHKPKIFFFKQENDTNLTSKVVFLSNLYQK